jgi:hypothetical protein
MINAKTLSLCLLSSDYYLGNISIYELLKQFVLLVKNNTSTAMKIIFEKHFENWY